MRPSGGIEYKGIEWCRENGFREVAAGMWAGEWWDDEVEESRSSLGEAKRKEIDEAIAPIAE